MNTPMRPRGPSGPPPGNASSIPEVLPPAVRALVKDNLREINPGLRLDKYARPGEMEQQQAELRELGLNQDAADPRVHKEVFDRRKTALGTATVWMRRTSEPLALHLARASVLENAGICLHPVYGFPYLPGTGLKGLARAWAETIWADSQPDAQKAWDRIHAVFGVGDETDNIVDSRGNVKQKPWKPSGVVRKKKSDQADADFVDSAGLVVFHDAWPTSPPRLQIDFATPHHKPYYERSDLPGDWDAPEPAAFLSIPPETEFQFAISGTSRCSDPTFIKDACKWLDDALTILGAGAKTNAGYGTFKLVSSAPHALPAKRFVTSTHQITLTTPAFFAGDQSDPRSCRLRGGTLRGLLRWWWRTMHAGYLEFGELLALEKGIWGGIAAESDQGTGSAVSIRVQLTSGTAPQSFDRNGLRHQFKLPWPQPGQRITPGLTFLSYGMDKKDKKEPSRFYLPSGATWELFIKARAAGNFTAEEVHREATNALWLLTRFGGLGAKSGKGFGCLALAGDDQSSQAVQNGIKSAWESAAQLRRKRTNDRPFQARDAIPGSWSACVPGTPTEFPLGKMPAGEQGLWAAIHRLGTAIGKFCADNRHKPEKQALGTPRKTEHDGRNWPGRHTSPVHYYLFQRDGQYWVRVVAFPSPRLPDPEFSRKYLAGFISALKTNLAQLAQENPVTGPPAAQMGNRSGPPMPTAPAGPARPAELATGAVVTGVLLEKKTNKGLWKARTNGVVGLIDRDPPVPPDAKPGQQVKLKVRVATGNPAFKYFGPA
jgi:CRISPR-associated protein Cmr6